MIYEPLTKLQCCPTSDGSAAAVLASEQFVIDNNLQEKVNIVIFIIVFLYKIVSCQEASFIFLGLLFMLLLRSDNLIV